MWWHECTLFRINYLICIVWSTELFSIFSTSVDTSYWLYCISLCETASNLHRYFWSIVHATETYMLKCNDVYALMFVEDGFEVINFNSRFP